MALRILNLLSLGILSAASSGQAANSVGDTRNTLQEWVETRRIISQEKSDWQVEQSIFTDTVGLLSNELERLNAELEEMEASATAADEDRAKLSAKKEKLNAASSVVEAHIGELETQMKAVLKTLPEPLVQKIKPLIRRLPEDSADTSLSLGERVQNIVGILSQADKFNGTLTQTNESREISEGKTVEVRTLYWGLAAAYYVDATGAYAGIGYPTAEGWEWPRIDNVGADIKLLIDVYEGSEAIQFIPVPARIK